MPSGTAAIFCDGPQFPKRWGGGGGVRGIFYIILKILFCYTNTKFLYTVELVFIVFFYFSSGPEQLEPIFRDSDSTPVFSPKVKAAGLGG